MKLVSAIINHKNGFNNDKTNSSILIYQNNGHVILLNDWDNPEYFTNSYLALFFGIRGHLFIIYRLKKEKMLLKAWDK